MVREMKGCWGLSRLWCGSHPERNKGSEYRVLGWRILEASKSPSPSVAEERRDWQVELDFGSPRGAGGAWVVQHSVGSTLPQPRQTPLSKQVPRTLWLDRLSLQPIPYLWLGGAAHSPFPWGSP